MKKEDLLAFVNNLEMLVATGSPYVHKLISSTPFTDDEMVIYAIEDSCNNDITLVVPPDTKSTLGFGLWMTDIGNRVHRKVKIIGGGEKLVGLDSLFEGLRADSIDCSEFDVSNVKEADFMFYRAKIKHLDLEWLRSAKLKSIKSMFRETETDVIDLNCLDVRLCESYNELFRSCNAEIIGELHGDKVTNTSHMFSMYKGNHKLDLSWLDMSEVTDCSNMFNSTEFLSLTLDLSNANKVEYAYNMFFTSNIRALKCSNITMNDLKDSRRMFFNARIDTVKMRSDAHQIGQATEMFSGVVANSIDLSEFAIKTSRMLHSSEMFKQAKTKFILCKRQVSGYPSNGWMKLTLMFGNNKNVTFDVV